MSVPHLAAESGYLDVPRYRYILKSTLRKWQKCRPPPPYNFKVWKQASQKTSSLTKRLLYAVEQPQSACRDQISFYHGKLFEVRRKQQRMFSVEVHCGSKRLVLNREDN